MTTSIWRSLVVETQFATELVLTGLRRLCSVPTGPALVMGSSERNYSLHVGMYSYSSGLERLCKLAISCHGYATTGKFTNVRPYMHRIGKLLNAVEALTPVGPGSSKRGGRYLIRPVDSLDPDLTNTIERFASGAGRYEHLDSLRDRDAEVSTFNEWSALATKAPVSAEVRKLVSLKDAMARAIGSELIDDELEATAGGFLEDFELPIYESSVSVALSLFRKVRWVSAVLEAIDYSTPDLPILGDVVSSVFILPSEFFFSYHIARITDEEIVAEELKAVFERINEREAAEDDEPFE